ncbi:uncharacterized protein LOC120334809 [Styela clava]|uniref:uncharacterized protein LOC120334809 n=1 Tax=Styela clava TaxID=7725 RepID=UPI001939B304|nr:uncharacterized protein LOC120334809 [Styela clava]
MATTVVIAAPASGHPGDAFKEEFKKIGISELTFGGCAIVFEIISLAIWISTYLLYTSAPGIYCGIWFCVCGGLAIGSYKQANQCNVVGGMVLAILSLFGCLGMIYYESYLIYLVTAAARGFHFLVIMHILLDICAIGMFVSACIHISICAKASRGG